MQIYITKETKIKKIIKEETQANITPIKDVLINFHMCSEQLEILMSLYDTNDKVLCIARFLGKSYFIYIFIDLIYAFSASTTFAFTSDLICSNVSSSRSAT